MSQDTTSEGVTPALCPSFAAGVCASRSAAWCPAHLSRWAGEASRPLVASATSPSAPSSLAEERGQYALSESPVI